MRRLYQATTIAACLLLAIALPACTGARHISVVADATFAQVVFAIDDAEFAACQTHAVITVAQCEAANPKIKQALIDVRAATKAIQDTPKSAQPPNTLVGLLADLTAIQAIFGDLSPGPLKASLTKQVTQALQQAITLLQAFTTVAGS